MNDQIPLVEVEAIPKLKPRQQVVLDALRRAGTDGLEPSEAGAHLHALKEGRWAHSAEERCVYCGRDGNAVLKRLRDLGLARYRGRMRVWQAADLDSNGRVESSQDTGWDKLLEAGF